MSTLISITSFILLCGVIVFPVLLLHYLDKKNVKHRFVVYLLFGVIVSIVLIFVFSWWTTTSDEMLLSSYGYDFDAINETERYANVPQRDISQVKNIESSLSGIGWPLKAIIAFVIYLPYLFVVYFVNYIITKRKAAKLGAL